MPLFFILLSINGWSIKPLLIEAYQAEVEAEYQEVLQIAEDNRQYWEERNREHFAQLATMPPKPGHEALRAKVQNWKDRLESIENYMGVGRVYIP